MIENKIKKLRRDQNKVNKILTKNLIARLKISKKIIQLKNENKIPIYDKQRENEILRQVQSLAKTKSEKAYLKKIFKAVLKSTRSA